MAGSDRGTPTRRPGGSQAQRPGRPPAGRGSGSSGSASGPRSRTAEKDAERTQAQELAARTGVPLWGAFRVVRGEIKLNDLLKSMLRREKFRKLQDREGLDPDLAGHVASGSLPTWRAKVLQDMRHAGRAKFTRDRIAMAHKEKLPIAIWRFGEQDWDAGSISKARTYDFTFVAPEVEPVSLYKHDVKMVCNPDDLPGLREAGKFEKVVLNEGLGSSRERKDRYRPTDQQLCAVRDAETVLKWVFRDGTAIAARIQAFGRWDMDILTAEGTPGTVFFHALHGATDRAIKRVTG